MMISYPMFSRMLAAAAALTIVACAPSRPVTPIAPNALAAEIGRSSAPLTMVHVWATWCDPCREEFPELVNVINAFPDLRVILVSADDPAEVAAIERFLAEHDSPLGSLVSTELNEAFITALSPNWAGSLPSTFFYRDGNLVREWEGKRTFEEYSEVIEQLLNKRKESST